MDSAVRQVHFVGICGTAMSAIAIELNASGFRITGSDQNPYPPTSTVLTNHGIEVFAGYHPGNIQPNTLIVIGNAISRGNPELEAALDASLPIISLPELISRRYLIKRKPIVLTGTHGKSTTTAMTAFILNECRKQPGWMIGGIPLDLTAPSNKGQGEFFVVEGDEYDTVYYDKRPKFFHYKPYIGVISGIEFDHADIYKNIEEIEDAFLKFARLIPSNGKLIVNGDDERAVRCSKNAFCEVILIGEGDNCDLRISNTTKSGDAGVNAEFTTADNGTFNLQLSIPGVHNIRNAAYALAAAVAAGVERDDALKVLRDFKGVQRRLQLLIENEEIALWDDFAHHPSAIKITLESLRLRYPDQRIVALLEPRSNTMVRNFHQQQLTDALSAAELVLLTPLHRGEMIEEAERLDVRELSSALENKGIACIVCTEFSEFSTAVEEQIVVGDVVVMLSNGSFGGIKEDLVKLIALKAGVEYSNLLNDQPSQNVGVDEEVVTCKTCGKVFIFTKSEAEYYASRGFDPPHHCRECRAQRRRSKSGAKTGNVVKAKGGAVWTEVICEDCQKQTIVPFKPVGDRPVYCRDCLVKNG
ncbi:Mur ligase family protein [Calditrichota bacterium]